MIAHLTRRIRKFLDPENPEFIPESTKEVSWAHYLERLTDVDRANVEEVLRRFHEFAYRQYLPLGIMAVGSVLYKPLGEYRDVDLLILPIKRMDLTSSESTLAQFITAQPELVRDKNQRPRERKWNGFHGYDINRYWDLQFPEGKPVQLFICTSYQQRTLREQIEAEIGLKAYSEQPYAFIVLDAED